MERRLSYNGFKNHHGKFTCEKGIQILPQNTRKSNGLLIEKLIDNPRWK